MTVKRRLVLFSVRGN